MTDTQTSFDVPVYLQEIASLQAEIERLRSPFQPVDDKDWEYLFSLIPDGGRGRFWKTVLNGARLALR